jgi:hypothetical protein
MVYFSALTRREFEEIVGTGLAWNVKINTCFCKSTELNEHMYCMPVLQRSYTSPRRADVTYDHMQTLG